MVLVGLMLAFFLGAFQLPWWTSLLAGLITTISLTRGDSARAMAATSRGNALSVAWGMLPCLALWWLGSNM